VAAQGGAALLWVLRALLRWLVGRVSGSHAVLDAYKRDDTVTYGVFLLTLATAIGVQLVAPVLWLLAGLFAGAQLWVLHRARPTGVWTGASRQHAATRVLLFAAGVATMLTATAWRRLLERQFGTSADLSTLITAALLAGLGLGVLAGARTARWRPDRLGALFVVLQLATALWNVASIALIPLVGGAVAGAALAVTVAAVVALIAVPMMLMGAAPMALLAALPWPSGARSRRAGASWALVLCGAALAGILAVDVLFAFTGIRGVIVGSAALGASSALGAVMLFTRRTTEGA